MKALVTGGAGFIGSHLAEHLLRAGYEVRIVDNFSTGHRSNLAGFAVHLEVMEGDLRSYEQAREAVGGCEVVFHQAAVPSVPRSIQDPLTSNAANVTGVLNVLLAARDEGVRRVVYASSSSVYGSAFGHPKREDMAPLPISPYAVGKLAGEGYCRSFGEVYGLESVALRYFNVFGPRQDPGSQYAAVIPGFVATVLAGGRPVVYGDGEQSRDFTYVENVVAANMLAMDAPGVAGRVYNIACGNEVTLVSLLDELGVLLDVEITPRFLPARPGDVRNSRADLACARRDLGYEPTVDLVEGLARTIASYRKVASRWASASVSSP